MANPQRGEVGLAIGERTVVLRPTFDALATIEKETGDTLPGLARRAIGRDLGVSHLLAIVREGAKAGGEAVSAAEIKIAIEMRFTDVAAACIAFIINAVTGGVTPEDAEKNGPAPAPNAPASQAPA